MACSSCYCLENILEPRKYWKFLFLTSYIGKDTKMSSVYFLEIECYYQLDSMTSTRVNDRQDTYLALIKSQV